MEIIIGIMIALILIAAGLCQDDPEAMERRRQDMILDLKIRKKMADEQVRDWEIQRKIRRERLMPPAKRTPPNNL